MKCTECKGKGKVMYEVYYSVKKIREIEFETCPKCKGLGVIEEVKK